MFWKFLGTSINQISSSINIIGSAHRRSQCHKVDGDKAANTLPRRDIDLHSIGLEPGNVAAFMDDLRAMPL